MTAAGAPGEAPRGHVSTTWAPMCAQPQRPQLLKYSFPVPRLQPCNLIARDGAQDSAVFLEGLPATSDKQPGLGAPLESISSSWDHTTSSHVWATMRVPWTAKRSNQSNLKEIGPEDSLGGLMLKLKLQYFGHLMRRTDSLEKTLMLGKIEGGRRRG